MLYKKLGVSWIIVSVLMFTLSYLWHGIVLNDFKRLYIQKDVYLMLMAIVYLVLGATVVGLNTILNSKKNEILKAGALGASLGIFIYLVTFVLGVSFDTSKQITHIIVDVVWQVTEQGTGGIVCGIIFSVFKNLRLIHT